MSTKRRWYELLLPSLVILLVLAAVTVKTANAYEYVQGDWEGYAYESAEIRDIGSTWEEYATTSSNANEETGVCKCLLYVYAKAKDDFALADADAYAFLLTDWTWDGPPGDAPGGELTWIHDAGGAKTGAWGNNTESATSSSGASAGSWSTGTEGSAWAYIDVCGYITNGETIDGECVPDADPYGELDPGEVNEYTTPPEYAFTVDGWSFSTGDEEIIASGTTYIYFAGGIDCEAMAVTTNRGTEYWAQAFADAEAEIEVDADFDSY